MTEQHPEETPAEAQQLAELLELERELTPEEQAILSRYSDEVWRTLTNDANSKVRAAYEVSDLSTFSNCMTVHMDQMATIDMVTSEVYHCPQCGRLLKDRRSPIASALLQERRRLAGMLTDVEDTQVDTPERASRWARFRAALGLS
jgi:hypothetical protein